MKQTNLFSKIERRIRNWFTLGLEEEFTQYGALAEYNISLASDNLIAACIALGALLTLDLICAPLSIALLDLRNVVIAIFIGVYIDQKNTRTNIHEKIYTSMYKAATKTGILVAQIDLPLNRFEVLQCPDYMESVLKGNIRADAALGQIETIFVAEPFREQLHQLLDLPTLPDRMAENGQLSFYFQDFRQVWYQLVIVEQTRTAGHTSAVVVIVRDVDEEKRKEIAYQQQLEQATLPGLTTPF